MVGWCSYTLFDCGSESTASVGEGGWLTLVDCCCSIVVSISEVVHEDTTPPPPSSRNFSPRLETFAGCTHADYTARARKSLLGEPGPAAQDVPGKHVRGRNNGCSERHGTTPRRQESVTAVRWRRWRGERPRAHPRLYCIVRYDTFGATFPHM